MLQTLVNDTIDDGRWLRGLLAVGCQVRYVLGEGDGRPGGADPGEGGLGGGRPGGAGPGVPALVPVEFDPRLDP